MYSKIIRIFYVITIIQFFTFFTACHTITKEKEIKQMQVHGEGSDTLNYAIIEFEESEHYFGRVYDGEQVGWFFKFRNKGTNDLIIKNAYSSCGCTIPDYSKEPVHPNGEGNIKVIFDSKGRIGVQTKTITVESNARNKIVTLHVSAEIINK